MLTLESFLTQDNIKLSGLLYTPGIEKVTEDVVIYVHGGSSNIYKNPERLNALGELFNKANISFFAFNNRGSGYISRMNRVDENGEEESVHLGASYETIREAELDFIGVSNFLRKKGFQKLTLLGHSTGANKICAYNFYNERVVFDRFVLLNGGDDTGITYEMMGAKKFKRALQKCEKMIKKGWGRKLAPKYLTNFIISYQSFYDLINPDGDYNIFPFFELLTGQQLGTKELLREFKSMRKPTLVIYGSEDEYCQGDVKSRVDLLRKAVSETRKKDLYNFKIVDGADHCFTGMEEELSNSVINWIKNK
ncbi:DUF1749 domain-containing protein [Candidatus Dojkabacteria bacterium]|nr:DUF1749 domain-containing protein [Candidatus Dojkabacteria bacterium]